MFVLFTHFLLSAYISSLRALAFISSRDDGVANKTGKRQFSALRFSIGEPAGDGCFIAGLRR